ncbi:putative Mitotic spindle checkpoint protein MAD2 [Blattamonas nauphoetae]|uniref:Mitotic spindle checkpoint protein MAD2 n=1 Tax=Blattamonas nauphoetae TaxID=2049346 RepID=A0ABQ9X854_9EUKA|nr:putative Mitotic spindle checkpoint protein MAD2 [Blattamonas nauphoetae]
MTASAQNVRSTIHLRGSTQIVTEFFGFSLNSILYQRGVYPPEKFQAVKRYGLPIHVTNDNGLKNYLGQVLTQLSEWLMAGTCQKLVLVIASANTNEVMERWVFDIETDQDAAVGTKQVEKSEKDIQNEIQAIIRQITVSVTLLPLLQEPCTFDVLVYTDEDAPVPVSWEESDAKLIQNASELPLRFFDTKIHKVQPSITYRTQD